MSMLGVGLIEDTQKSSDSRRLLFRVLFGVAAILPFVAVGALLLTK